jgi:hypothetical protein
MLIESGFNWDGRMHYRRVYAGAQSRRFVSFKTAVEFEIEPLAG